MLRPGMYLQERYEIIEQVGSGGMADVYKAMCHTLNRLVAIKVLRKDLARKKKLLIGLSWKPRRRPGFPIPTL